MNVAQSLGVAVLVFISQQAGALESKDVGQTFYDLSPKQVTCYNQKLVVNFRGELTEKQLESNQSCAMFSNITSVSYRVLNFSKDSLNHNSKFMGIARCHVDTFDTSQIDIKIFSNKKEVHVQTEISGESTHTFSGCAQSETL